MKKMRPDPTRREFIQLVGGGVATFYLTGSSAFLEGCALPKKPDLNAGAEARQDLFWRNTSPIDRTPGVWAQSGFSGDNPTRPHEILWNKDEFMASQNGKVPVAQETVDVAIIGGGMSGMISAYYLRDQKPVILEQAPRFGGNSRGQSWNGIDYSIGAAYTDVPEPGSPIDLFWKEIGVAQKFKLWKGSDPLYYKGVKYPDCWTEGTVEGTKGQFQALAKHFEDVAHERNGLVFPEIPTSNPEVRKVVNKLDQISFKTYLEKFLGAPLHPHVEQYIDYYFWTACAGSYSEVSAASALNFFTSDFSSVAVFPGGNAGIADAVYARLLETLGSDRLRPSSLVFDVSVDEKGVSISYLDAENQVKRLRARYTVMAAPKFIVKNIVRDLEPERVDAISSLKYRAYLVASVLLEQDVAKDFYDAYFLDFEGVRSRKMRIRELAEHQKVTDVILGSYSSVEPGRAVLTLSRAMPYEGGREEVYKTGAYARFKKEFEEQLVRSILPQMGISRQKWVGINICRWGHPLPLSSVGNIASGRVDLLRKPFRGRLFFAEQDNWTLPSFETAFHEALTWSSEIRKLV